jgi:thiol-disulfide isomerase/thioredoxin
METPCNNGFHLPSNLNKFADYVLLFMKQLIAIIFCLVFLLEANAQGYKITLQTHPYDSGLCYLTYHMGKNLNIADSGFINKKGILVFQKKDTLPGGIYAIVFPGKRRSLDFFIDKDQVITIKADTNDLLNAKVTGSPENDLFQEYQRFISVKGSQMQTEKMAYASATNAKDSALHEANYKKYNKELTDYRNGIIQNKPNSLMAVMLQSMKEPDVPMENPKTRQDSLNNYYYYKAHFWDGVTFMDRRIIRSPFFQPKLERYYRNVMPQDPDSIIADLDYKLLLARSSPDMYKFLLNWSTDEYINPKIMGHDAIFVHLFNKYHSKGLTPWLNEKQMETISRRAYMQMANLIGEKAADLNMLDTSGRPVTLYGLKSDFTVVVFWDPNCGHCKEEVPRIDSIYRASWKQKGVSIFAVLTEDHIPEWKAYIAKNKISGWTHAYESKEMAAAVTAAGTPSFRQLYDVISTPTIYLLDSEKRIIGKKLTWSQLDDLINVKRNQMKEKSGK